MPDHDALIAAARQARTQSVSPYSKFAVGAALLTQGGDLITGANVESASYGLSCCAERVALFKALTEGHQHFAALAVASPGGAAPCGACRQLIAEFAAEAQLFIIDSNLEECPPPTTISILLPLSFTADDLPTD
ncbi:MAG TPA: cytidine deaminase [Verrucomicrobiales bacterium]|nr:cytidine deaminase [Verrucomicrobiales bacterium]|tara:strand:+ start:2168 stop:2569 length:402 start_codon:yes stop_codon:yes gene_type:complete